VSDLLWLDPEEQRLFRAFARSTRWLFVQFDRDLQRDANMPRTYFEILWLLHEAPGRSLRMSDLAAATGSQPSRITHAVGRLEEAGRVRRELCTDDRRGWFTVLTDEGLEALKLAAPKYAESIRERLFEPLSRSQREQLRLIGETLLQALEVSGAPAPSRHASTIGDPPDAAA
jgi:DNA-binding MarR family transcriptional regulator